MKSKLNSILTWARMNNDPSIYSDQFKQEVIAAHREFFLKRGMDPDSLPRLWDLGDRISSSFPQKSDPPIERYAPSSFRIADILKQKNDASSGTTFQ